MRPGLFLLLLSVPSFPGFAMTSLSKKVCIVVGLGKGGIGEHVAKRFASEDYNIAMIARSSLQHLEQQIPNSKGYQCDAGNPEEVSRTVEAIRKDFGDSIHALMYNAGSGVFKPFEQTTYEEFDIAFRTGPGGIFLWTKACLPYMPAGSAIGLTGATASWRGMPFTPAFASSKMATRGLAQALARDLGPNKGIHVFHVVIDGLVQLGEESAQKYGKAENEMLNPADIAETYWQLSQQPVSCWTQETHVAAQGAFGSIASI